MTTADRALRPCPDPGTPEDSRSVTDDITPIGHYPDGYPRYGDTEVDTRFEDLLGRYQFSPGEPESERMAVANAFTAVVAPENLAHADDAVETLRILCMHEEDSGLLQDLLKRYDDGGPNPDRKTVAAGLKAVAANPANSKDAIAVLEAMVDLAQRRASHLAKLGLAL